MTTDSARYLESVHLLEDVADFLTHMPKHPMTHDMCMRVRRFLEAPGARIENERMANADALRTMAQEAMSGSLHVGWTCLAPSGAPLVSCALRGDRLEIHSPGLNESELSEMETADRQNQVAQALRRGIDLKLRRPEPYELKAMGKDGL